ncbi:hypothetical protein SAMN05428987_5140 [Paenibacillus sp. CF095]|nr:hypothetical protein SAMN05428987_5140 [Paenibacillus sp. CF095]
MGGVNCREEILRDTIAIVSAKGILLFTPSDRLYEEGEHTFR